MPLFGASKMTPSGPGWTSYSIRQYFAKILTLSAVQHFLSSFLFRHRTTPQGFDIPLLWVPGRRVARASAVLGGTLTGCGPFETFLSTGNGSKFL